MKFSVKKGDNVLVLAGKDKGKQGEVLEVNRETKRVLVAGVNIQTKHKKPRNKDDKGGILKTEGLIDISNVQVVCPTCKKATRVAHSLVNGKSARVCKKCGASLDVAKKAKTTKPVKAEKTKEVKAEKVEEKVETPVKETKTASKPAKTTKPATKTTKTSAPKTTKTATKVEEKTTKTTKPAKAKSEKKA